MNALIVTGGNVDRLFLKEEINKNIYNYIIAVDKGTEYLYELNIEPNILIGDFDSSKKEFVDFYLNKGIEVLKYSSEKDMTDTEIAIDYIINKKIDNITIIGATGSRLDHTLANIHILEKYCEKSKCKIIDKHNNIRVLKGKNEISLDKHMYKYVSLLPISREVTGITTKGLKYELNDSVINRDSSLGVSNEIIDDTCSIKIRDGIITIIQSND